MPPSSEGGAAKGDTCRTGLWGGALPWKKGGEYLRTRDSGRDIPMAVKGGNRSEPWNHDPPPLHPDTRLNASQDGF